VFGPSCVRSSGQPSTRASRRKKLRSIIGGGFGNAATRLKAYVVSNGSFAYGSYPALAGLLQNRPRSLIV